MESETIICPECHTAVPASAFFCFHCGKVLKEKQSSTSLSKQILIYAVSFFLPPLGFTYVWKYFKQKDEKSREIALIAGILTIFSIVISFWIAQDIMNSYLQSLNGLDVLIQ